MEEGRPCEEPPPPGAPAPERMGAGDAEEPIAITADMLAEVPERDSRIDFEKGMSCLPRLTLALIAVNSAVFAWEAASGVFGHESTARAREAIIAAGALSREHVLRGEVWRLFSAMFLHGGPDHLIGNCIVLYVLGMACEHALGIRQSALVYFAGGLCGSILSMSMHEGPSVGASGAIFGVMGSVAVFLYRHQGSFHLRNKRVGSVLAIWAAYQIATGFLTPFIDNFAHIGGILGGAGVTFALTPVLAKAPEETAGRGRDPA